MTSVSTGEATKTILETTDFLNEHLMDVDDGQEKDDTITSYCINQSKAIGKLTFDIADATAAMKLVREHEWMFDTDGSRLHGSLVRL